MGRKDLHLLALLVAATIATAGTIKVTPSTCDSSAPCKLTGVVLVPGAVRLTWQDNTVREKGFQIFRAIGAKGKWDKLVQLGPNQTQYEDLTVKPGTVYFYKVRGI